MKKYRGLGLLEILLVLVVVGILAVLAAKRYKAYEFEKNVAVLKKTVATLIYSLDRYYFQTCGPQTPGGTSVNWHNASYKVAAPNETGIKLLGLTPDEVRNPFDGGLGYVFGTKDTEVDPKGGQPYYLRQLYVSLSIDKQYLGTSNLLTNNALYFQNLFHATSMDTSTGTLWLTWSFAPYNVNTVSMDPTDPDWILQLNTRKYLQQVDPANPCWFPQVSS